MTKALAALSVPLLCAGLLPGEAMAEEAGLIPVNAYSAPASVWRAEGGMTGKDDKGRSYEGDMAVVIEEGDIHLEIVLEAPFPYPIVNSPVANIVFENIVDTTTGARLPDMKWLGIPLYIREGRRPVVGLVDRSNRRRNQACTIEAWFTLLDEPFSRIDGTFACDAIEGAFTATGSWEAIE